MDFNQIFTALNNEGKGYSVGNSADDINEIGGIGTKIVRSYNDSEVAVYDNGTHYVIVGDANGPWAVDCPKE